MFESDDSMSESLASSSSENQPVIDIAQAVNSAQACQMIERFIQYAGQGGHKSVDLNAGGLLLTRGVLSKIHLQLRRHGLRLNAVYSTVPQTQQAALDEGFFVREAPRRDTLTSMAQLKQEIARQDSQPPKADVVQLPTPTPPKEIELPQFGYGTSVAATAGYRTAAVAKNSLTQKAQTTLTLNEISAALQADANAVPVADLSYDLHSRVELCPTQKVEMDAEEADGLPTLLVKHTLRSGQVLRYQGHVVVIGDAHAGSEIIADGDIIVWGEIRGIAHAGQANTGQVNHKSEIRAMKIEALQLRIGDFIARRPDRIYYHKPQGSQVPAPEVAKVSEGEIRIFKESTV